MASNERAALKQSRSVKSKTSPAASSPSTGQTHQVVEHYAAKVNRRKLGKSAIVKFSAARKASRLKCNALDSAT